MPVRCRFEAGGAVEPVEPVESAFGHSAIDTTAPTDAPAAAAYVLARCLASGHRRDARPVLSFAIGGGDAARAAARAVSVDADLPKAGYCRRRRRRFLRDRVLRHRERFDAGAGAEVPDVASCDVATFPLNPPIAPMLAKLSPEIPEGDGWFYEPKWDGFRCIVFRSGDDIELASRNEKPFNRYFPELIAPLLGAFPDQAVVDGEIVLPSTTGQGLDFDALQQRIHPAASRVKRLSEETPAMFVAFDALSLGGTDLMSTPFPSLCTRYPATTQSAVRVCLIFAMTRLSGT